MCGLQVVPGLFLWQHCKVTQKRRLCQWPGRPPPQAQGSGHSAQSTPHTPHCHLRGSWPPGQLPRHLGDAAGDYLLPTLTPGKSWTPACPAPRQALASLCLGLTGWNWAPRQLSAH